jgi:hypothetical protein
MKPETIDITNKHERYQFTAYVGHVFSEMGLLGEYVTAINLIIKDLKSTKTRVDIVAHPLLYMMRHSLELGYKSNFEYFEPYSNLQTSKKISGCHDLQKLHVEFKTHFDLINIALNFDNDLLTEFDNYYIQTTKLINQLGSTEASSFRYTKNTKGQRIFQSKDTKDIGEIKELYDRAITMLAHTSDLISPYTDYKDLINKVPNFQGGIGTVQMTFSSLQLNSIADRLDEQYEKLDHFKWKDKVAGQILIVVTVDNNCYLTPIRQ